MTPEGLTNRRNWRSFCSRKAVTQVTITETWQNDLTGVLQWMFRSSLEGSVEEEDLIGWLCIRGISAVYSSRNSDDKFECSWVRFRGKDNNANNLVRVFIDHSTTMKRWMKHSIGGWLTFHNCQSLLLWQILTGWMSAGNSIQQIRGSPGGLGVCGISCPSWQGTYQG